MSNLEIKLNQADAIAVHSNSNSTGKQLLEAKFGKEIFSVKITDRLKTFEDACAIMNVNPFDVLTHKGTFFNAKQKRTNAADKLEVIIQAANEGWVPDWNDKNQAKFYPWFEYGSKGFSLRSVNAFYQDSDVPSCLCFKNREIATYVVNQFISIYNEYLN